MKKRTQFNISSREKLRNRIINYQKMYPISRSLHRIYCQTTHFLHPFPDYLIIGASRSGTSSLYEYIIQHPDVKPAITKQIHFFDKYFDRGIAWYKGCFPFNIKAKKNFITGEATPYYLCHPLAPSRISKIIPNVKLIVLLRNSVDRTYSHYKMEFSRKKEDLSFEDALEKENERLNGEIEKIINNPKYSSNHFPTHAYIYSSLYYDQIKMWLNFFPREQFLFIKSEDMFEHIDKIYNQTLTFLGLSPFRLNNYETVRKGNYSIMNHTTREQLKKYFQPYNEKLYHLIGRDLKWEEE